MTNVIKIEYVTCNNKSVDIIYLTSSSVVYYALGLFSQEKWIAIIILQGIICIIPNNYVCP